MSSTMAAKIGFLCERGAATQPHSAVSLLSHLLGTRERLVEWGCSEAVCDAGLFHSVYGTQDFGRAVVPARARASVRELLGARAEQLVYVFGTMERDSLYDTLRSPGPHAVTHRGDHRAIALGGDEVADLCHLVLANWLEQRPRLAAPYRLAQGDELRRMQPWLVPAAWAELDHVYGFTGSTARARSERS
ncbi:MAG: DUF6817 domain-containing protein [Nannocystaceae bacterium]